MSRVVTTTDLQQDLMSVKETLRRMDLLHYWRPELELFTNVTLPLLHDHLERATPTQVVA